MATGMILILFGTGSAMIASAARSDFVFRGCGDIPRADWAATANCADGWLAQVVFGIVGVFCVLGAIILWRRGRTA